MICVYVVRHDPRYKPKCYIGQTDNAWKRITQHFNGEGSINTIKYGATEILSMKMCTNREHALGWEKTLQELQQRKGISVWLPEKQQCSFIGKQAMRYVNAYFGKN